MQIDDLQMPRAPCSRKTTRTLHACIIQICTKDKEQSCIVLRLERCSGNPFAHCQLLLVVVCVSDREDFDFLVVFLNTAKCTYTCSTTCWLSPTLPACLRCRTLIGTHKAPLCRADYAALCCACSPNTVDASQRT